MFWNLMLVNEQHSLCFKVTNYTFWNSEMFELDFAMIHVTNMLHLQLQLRICNSKLNLLLDPPPSFSLPKGMLDYDWWYSKHWFDGLIISHIVYIYVTKIELSTWCIYRVTIVHKSYNLITIIKSLDRTLIIVQKMANGQPPTTIMYIHTPCMHIIINMYIHTYMHIKYIRTYIHT